jgi:phosphate transport system substrate-binding protein
MKKTLIALFALGIVSTAAYAEDSIRIVGSSTVYPFTTTVAESFGKSTGMPTPIVESTGTGGGIKMFCDGVGDGTPDAVNASRPMKETEIEMCKKNGVTADEIKIGFDAIVLAMSSVDDDVSITSKQIYQALAMYVPVDGKFVENKVEKWNEIDPSLPDKKIEVLGPPPTSGTRDSFTELVLEKECKKAAKEAGIELSADDEKKYCKTIRDDGAYIEAGENDNLIVQKLINNPNALGIFGFSFLEENGSTIKAAKIDGVETSFESVSDGSYPISRPLFIYVKKEHYDTVPGLKEFVEEYQSEKAIGEDGYLVDKGLIPIP